MKHSIDKTNFANGASLHHLGIADSPVVEAKISFSCGFLMFSPDKHHVPHMLEHLLLGASDRFMEEALLIRYLQRLGAQANASTGFDELSVVLRAPVVSFMDALQAVWDSVFSAKPTSNSVEHERDVIRREIYERFDGIQSHVTAGMLADTLRDYPATIEEQLEGLEGLDIEDVIQAYARYITANGTKVVVSGTVAATDVKRIKTLIEALPRSADYGTDERSPLKAELDNSATVYPVATENQESGLLQIQFTSPTQLTREGRAAKSLAVALMFDSPAAVVPEYLRKSGLIYSWDTDAIRLQGVDIYIVSMTTNILELYQATAETLRLIAEASYGNIDEQTFLDVRSFVELNLPTLQETSSELLEWYEPDIRHGYEFMALDEEVSLMHAQTRPSVQKVVRSIFMESDMRISVAGSPAVQQWGPKAEALVRSIKTGEGKRSGVALHERVDSFAEAACKLEAVKSRRHQTFFVIYPFLMWIGAIMALRVAYLPYINDASATVSMFDAIYDRGMWLWGAGLFLPLIIGLTLSSFFEDTAKRVLITCGLFFSSSLAYAYGLAFIFGDIGKENVPFFWQDVASVIHPLLFLLLTPLALYWAIKAYLTEKRAAKHADLTDE